MNVNLVLCLHIDTLISHGISLSAKDALFTSVIYAISRIYPDIYNYTSLDFQKLLYAISRSPETKIVDITLLIAVWSYSLLRQRSDSNKQHPIPNKSHWNIKDIVSLFDLYGDLQNVISSPLLFKYLQEWLKIDGKYISVSKFHTLLVNDCQIYLSNSQYEIFRDICLQSQLWVRDTSIPLDEELNNDDDMYVIDLNLLLQVMHMSIYKTTMNDKNTIGYSNSHYDNKQYPGSSGRELKSSSNDLANVISQTGSLAEPSNISEYHPVQYGNQLRSAVLAICSYWENVEHLLTNVMQISCQNITSKDATAISRNKLNPAAQAAG